MIRAIEITEIYSDEQPNTYLCDYDKLPENVKAKVDEALQEEEESVRVEVYEDGIQYLWTYEEENNIELSVKKGDIVEFFGSVTFYEK
jgi:hypothetical protein